MRSIERIVGCSINTVDKLLRDAGEAALAYHDKAVRGVKAQRIQCDEIWASSHAKQKNVADSKRAGDPTAGDCWTWTAIDADTQAADLLSGRRAGCGIRADADGRSSRPAGEPGATDDGRPQGVSAERSRKRSARTSTTRMLVKLYGAAADDRRRPRGATAPQSASAPAKTRSPATPTRSTSARATPSGRT